VNLERIVAGLVEMVERRFYGKYRGIVVSNEDPMLLGRVKVRVPSVLGMDVVTGWATPCTPYGGSPGEGFLFVPEPEATVWVEFEEGDPEFPIWVGAMWSTSDTGSQVPRPNEVDGAQRSDVANPPTRRVIKTRKGHTIQFEDADGQEVVLVREGVKGHLITMDRDGVTITDATGNSITMTGSAMTVRSVVPFTIDAAGQAVSIVCDRIDFEKG
jgi:uncharacterized protein involved in type VI secretion and phage assembly